MCTSRQRRAPLFFLVNFALVLLGLTGILVSLFGLRGSVLHKCPQCRNFQTLMYVACGVVIGVGLLGLMAQEMRSKVTLLVFKFFLFLLFCLAVAAVAAVIFVRVGIFNKLLSYGWNAAVKKHPTDVCEFQQLFRCTGWESNCNYTAIVPHASRAALLLNSQSTDFVPDAREAVTHIINWIPWGPTRTDCPTCNSSDAQGGTQFNFTGISTTCSTVVVRSIEVNFAKILLGALLSFVVISVVNFLAHRAGRKYSYLFDSSDFDDGFEEDESRPINARSARREA